MNPKYTYAIIYGIWGFLISLLLGFFSAGATAGLIYFTPLGGESPDDLLSTIPTTVAAIVIFATTVGAISLGYRHGKKHQETYNKKKAATLLALSIFTILAGITFAILYFNNQLHPKEAKCLYNNECVYQGSCINRAYYDPKTITQIECDPSKPEECPIKCACVNDECSIIK